MARILLVEDEEALSRLMKTCLERLGHEVVCCLTAADGLSALGAACPAFDLAILDHWLPDMNGMEMLSAVLTSAPRLRVLIASGNPPGDSELPAEGGQRVRCLRKPFLPKMLGEAIEQLLQG
ncbi:MAG: response regulator [Acidobacteria bacterium]|nr:response regulator [Acidobacteriota bacterium]